MARASGLQLAGGPEGNDPVAASSAGTGELIVEALDAGARRIIVGLGGSATTDGGLAALQAMHPLGRLKGIELVVACDSRVPFLEAATVFAPQKGASEAQVALLTRRLASLAAQYEQRTGVDVRAVPGGGAAGGLAGGLAAIGAELEPGFDVVAGAVDLERALEDVDLVVTGEGKLDGTSFAGKVVGGVLEWTADAGVPHVAVIAGQVTPEARDEMALYANAQLLALTDRVWQSAEAFSRAAVLVEEAALEAGRTVLDRPGLD
jgi:glycerate kinase